MANETRDKLPLGYSWQEVPEMRTAFPKPDRWHYRYQAVGDTQACFITREQILANGFFTTPQEVTSGQGFGTGLTVDTLPGIYRNFRVSAAEFAISALTTNPLLNPEGDIETTQDRQLAVYRGYFRSGSRLLAHRGIPATRYYIEATGNNQTDRVHVIMFETPEELWEQYKEVGKVIIDNRVLGQDF